MTDTTQTPEAPAAPTFEEIFRYDPFAEAEAAPLSEPEEATPPADEPAVVDPEGRSPAPEPEPAKPVVDPVVAQLLAQQAETQRLLVEQARKPEAPAEPEGLPFTAQVPDGLISLLRSEDPGEFASGVHALVNGAATMAYTKARQEFQHELASLRANLPGLIGEQTTAAQTQQQARQVFYGAYPKLDNPAAAATVAETAKIVATRRMSQGKPFTGMTQDFADEVAGEIAAAFGVPVEAFKGGQAPAVSLKAPSAPPKPQPFNPTGGVRPVPQPSADEKFASLGLDIF